MTYRMLTVNREFGSGGGLVAERIARKLGWKLLDRDIIDAIAYAAHVDARLVQGYDERVQGWLSRINQQAMRSAALAAGITLDDQHVFDAEETVKLSQKIIEEAYSQGNCVVVGRGSQCVLQNKPDVFHVFVYAPWKERLRRLHERLDKGVDAEKRMRAVDEERARYLQQFFGKCWTNPHLYDLMLSSAPGEEWTAEIILNTMQSR